MKKLIVAVLFASACMAQEKPKVEHKPLAEVNKLKLVTAFQKSQNLQMQVQQRAMDLCKAEPNCSVLWTRYQQAVAETNTTADQVAKTESLPPGTQFSVDTDKSEVSYVLPETKPEPKK